MSLMVYDDLAFGQLSSRPLSSPTTEKLHASSIYRVLKGLSSSLIDLFQHQYATDRTNTCIRRLCHQTGIHLLSGLIAGE